MENTIHLLWTGGWDSTFRLVELSFQDVDIYPVYVIDPIRRSVDLEIKAMRDIIEALSSKPATKAKIHDIIMVHRDDIPEDARITEAYNKIYKKTNLGPQHEWLARLGKIMPELEMGTEAGNVQTSRILNAIDTYGLSLSSHQESFPRI